MRSSTTNIGQQASRSYKQNSHHDIYQLDPKIIELKKKYQLETKPAPQNTSYNAHHRHTTNLRQQQVLKKLENIKSELQLIPDWQNYAKSILFDSNIYTDPKKARHTAQQFSRQPSKIQSKYTPEPSYIKQQHQHFQESRVLDNSNISFKINHNTSVSNGQDKNISITKDKNYGGNFKYINEQKNNSPLGGYSNSKAYVKQKSAGNDSRSCVDDKINEISRKIKQSEIKKRTLGVDFKPFQDKSDSKADCSKFSIDQQIKSRTPQYISKMNSISVDKLYYRPPKPPVIVSKFNEGFNEISYFKDQDQKYDKDISPRFANTDLNKQKQKISFQNKSQLHQIENKGTINNEKAKKNRSYSVYENIYCNPQYGNQRNYEEQFVQNSRNTKMIEKANEGVKQRKRKVENMEQKKRGKQNTKKLVQAFCEQVKLDEKFRNCKLWFKAYKNDKKMNRLKSLLEVEGIRLSEQKLMNEFEVQQKQDNPFFSVSSQECDVEEVAKSYIESEKFWRKSLYKKFSREGLESEDFNNLSIDLDKKGYIVLEDLVRFLNMETGTFFRNRDLFTIFKRLSSNSSKVNFKDFINNFYA